MSPIRTLKIAPSYSESMWLYRPWDLQLSIKRAVKVVGKELQSRKFEKHLRKEKLQKLNPTLLLRFSKFSFLTRKSKPLTAEERSSVQKSLIWLNG